MNRSDFKTMLIAGCQDEAAKNHPEESSRVADKILDACPDDGDLSVFGTRRDIKRALIKRVKDKEDGVGFGPIFLILLSALLQFLIQWWFRDRKQHTEVLASLKKEA